MNKYDTSNFHKSSFTITFAIELLGIDIWHDCNEGWLDLGPCTQGIRIQYQLYPGNNFELDVLVWPHCAKIWCGGQNYGWTRTWQYLERRWLTFSVRHAFPVRIVELRNFVATITPVLGIGALSSAAKNDKNFEIYLPGLRFGEKRYFGRVTETENDPLTLFISQLIWESVEDHIPSSFLDGAFDVPHIVTDVRLQDAVLYQVQQLTLNNKVSKEMADISEIEDVKGKDKNKKSPPKKSNEALKTLNVKYELRLTGDSILSGTGRIIPFEVVGHRPADLGEVVALLSSNNLPAQDDLPMVFVNIDNLTDIPVEEFKKAGIQEVYGRWSLGEEVRCTQPQLIRSKTEISLNDHHSVPLEFQNVTKTVANFLDNLFEIELRGTRKCTPIDVNPKFFERDQKFNEFVLKAANDNEDDILIAVCQIDASSLSKGTNGFVAGEFPLYPPQIETVFINREATCTNDINFIRAPAKPAMFVPPPVILEAQMTLQVAMGYVGCSAKKLSESYSRMYCIVHTEMTAKNLVNYILEINKICKDSESHEDLLTGFAVDAGSEVFLYVEGPKDKDILKLWEYTADYFFDMEIWFSTTARFSTRLYDDLLLAPGSFMVLKMHVPLPSLLSCPTVYLRTNLPSPARSAVLKFGQILSGKVHNAPLKSEMPTMSELQSFRLELCAPPKLPIL